MFRIKARAQQTSVPSELHSDTFSSMTRQKVGGTAPSPPIGQRRKPRSLHVESNLFRDSQLLGVEVRVKCKQGDPKVDSQGEKPRQGEAARELWGRWTPEVDSSVRRWRCKGAVMTQVQSKSGSRVEAPPKFWLFQSRLQIFTQQL